MRVKYPLQSCVWELTLACCFSCRYCGSSGGRARDGELTTAECFSVAEQLADLGCKRVSLIGGCRSYNYFTHNHLYESLYCAGREERF